MHALLLVAEFPPPDELKIKWVCGVVGTQHTTFNQIEKCCSICICLVLSVGFSWEWWKKTALSTLRSCIFPMCEVCSSSSQVKRTCLINGAGWLGNVMNDLTNNLKVKKFEKLWENNDICTFILPWNSMSSFYLVIICLPFPCFILFLIRRHSNLEVNLLCKLFRQLKKNVFFSSFFGVPFQLEQNQLGVLTQWWPERFACQSTYS